MELETQTSSQADPSPVSQAPAESAPQSAATPNANESSATASADGTTAPAPFTPDFKFKVMDKEHEIDPLFQPVIKDEESLKKVRRMQEQVLGLPHLEASRDEYKNKYNTALPRLQEYETVEKRLGKLSHLVQNRDFGSFFDELKIPRAEVLRWVKQELDADTLPPQIRQQVEQARVVAAKQYDAEQELAYYRNQNAMTQQEQVFQQVDQTIGQIAGSVAEQFNSRMQEPLAFRNAVINKGSAIQQATGQKLPLQEVISLVKQDLARVMGITEGSGAQPNAQGGVAPQGQGANAKPAVIPNIKAGAASPVKTPPRSIADLKKLAESM